MAERLCNKIEEEFTDNPIYCEPFVGGGSIMLYIAQKYPKIPIICNDKNRYISTFWKVIVGGNDAYNELLERIKIPVTISHFKKERVLQKSGKEIPIDHIAYHAIFFNKTTVNGMFDGNPIGGINQRNRGEKRTYLVDCRYNYEKLIESIVEARKRLLGRTTVHETDGVQLIDKCDDGNVVFYIDPPYPKFGDILYPTLMSAPEHKKLATVLKTKPHWIVSYNDDPEIKNFYKFANIETWNFCYSSTSFTKTSGSCKSKRKNELIIQPRGD